MMRHGEIKDKAQFVFDLISQKKGQESFSFPELVVFYFKIIDEFDISENPDLLLNEDFNEYMEGTVDEKEAFTRELTQNLIASISLADVFFNLMRIKISNVVKRIDFIEFIQSFPKTMELLNFIDLNDKDFKNIKNINKTTQYLDIVRNLLLDINAAFKAGNSTATSSLKKANHLNIINMHNFFEKVGIIHKEVQNTEEYSIKMPRSSNQHNRLFDSKNIISNNNSNGNTGSSYSKNLISLAEKHEPETPMNGSLNEDSFSKRINEAKQIFESNFAEPESLPTNLVNGVNSNPIGRTTFLYFRKKDKNKSDTIPLNEEKTTNQSPFLKKIEINEDINSVQSYTKNINRVQKMGEKNIYMVRLEIIYQKLQDLYLRLKEDTEKEKAKVFPLQEQDQTIPSQKDINKIRSKKKKKTLRKQLKIYDQNFCIAMAFVNALNKSLFFLNNEKHQTPRKRDFKLENMVSLSNLNKDIYDYCEFIDIAPLVFQRLRFYDGITNEDFIRDIGYNDFKAIFAKKMHSLKEEKSTGKSGSVFFQSSNGKYFIKTIRDSEVKILIKTLPNYYNHLENTPNSLLSRYYGLHKLRFYKNDKMKKSFFLVIMNNVFHNGLKPISPNMIFDLKGSTFKRRTKPEKLRLKAAGKDLNFLDMMNTNEIVIDVDRNKLVSLLTVIKTDSEFLAKNNTIDYR